MEFSHYSVMLNECIEALDIHPDGIYVDATAGGAGHSLEIAKRLSSGKLIAFDQDPDAVAIATERLKAYPCAQVIQSNFRNISEVMQEQNIHQIDGILMDLGVSSFQLDNGDRGFSYRFDAPLDMRMSKHGLSAKDIVNTYSVEELSRILREYGEEKFAYSIALNIEKARQKQPIETTFELSEIIKSSMPAAARRDKNPSKRSFQALRIAVNGELDSLSEGMDKAFELLAPKGRMVILTFHSLEDRMVKQRFQSWCKGCICPPDFPVCVCGRKPRAELVNRKPLVASEEELNKNKRSQSAKLRALMKL